VTGVKALTGLLVAVALLVMPFTAQAQLPVGVADGVRVVRSPERGIVVIFTADAAKLYKRIAGKKVIVSCTTLLDDGRNIGSQAMRAPRRRGRLVTGDLTRGIDFCRVWLAPRKGRLRGHPVRLGRTLIVSVPLTQEGAVFVDEEAKAFEMLQLGVVAGFVQERLKLPGYPTYEQLVGEIPRLGRAAVKLAAPSDTPPAGKVGYYSDGVEHLATVTLSASGRRLFIETAADDVFSTNVLEYIVNERD
jgi:hypothetical protein